MLAPLAFDPRADDAMVLLSERRSLAGCTIICCLIVGSFGAVGCFLRGICCTIICHLVSLGLQ
jgi:hypothetical protein